MVIALAVSGVVLTAALAVAVLVSFKRLSLRISSLESMAKSARSRFEAPEAENIFVAVPPNETDVTGAWAAEQERLGIHISDEEIEEQRRMWAAEMASC